jgi:transcriptional regulator with XRE-family HTH domain
MNMKKNKLTWLEQSDYFEKNNYWLAKSRKLALKILMHIKREKISQKDLAEKLEVSPQQINKIVRGGSNNMTFQTICKLERELGIELIVIPEAVSWSSIMPFEMNNIGHKTENEYMNLFSKHGGARIIHLKSTKVSNRNEQTYEQLEEM